jgi:hypothetical protein
MFSLSPGTPLGQGLNIRGRGEVMKGRGNAPFSCQVQLILTIGEGSLRCVLPEFT